MSAIGACAQEEGSAVSGVYFYGHDTSAFIRCGTYDIWWVDGSGEGMESLMAVYKESGVRPYGNLYVTLRGEFEPKEGNTDFVGILLVHEFVDYSRAIETILACVPNVDDLNQQDLNGKRPAFEPF